MASSLICWAKLFQGLSFIRYQLKEKLFFSCFMEYKHSSIILLRFLYECVISLVIMISIMLISMHRVLKMKECGLWLLLWIELLDYLLKKRKKMALNSARYKFSINQWCLFLLHLIFMITYWFLCTYLAIAIHLPQPTNWCLSCLPPAYLGCAIVLINNDLFTIKKFIYLSCHGVMFFIFFCR